MQYDSMQQLVTATAAEKNAFSETAIEIQPHRNATTTTGASQASGSSTGGMGDIVASPSSPESAQIPRKRRRRLYIKIREIKPGAKQGSRWRRLGLKTENDSEGVTSPVQSEPVSGRGSTSPNSASESGGEADLTRASINPAPEIGGKTESGWAAVARSIRDIDEQKIKGYTDDIDNILFFAGLYSAVLTALLVESYQGLQPNPSNIMITLLGQLVTQTHTYTLTNGYLNSTVSPLEVSAVPLQFEPSLAARRVNVLWFASLTLSLISASFGILVKQWLREYLSGESVSPQAQLRIRHFRAPGLDHWRVFTIAALLPLVLQLALALFFIGLCIFTLDIHHSIGYTTIPLVAGWAFLVMAASAGPAFSPRCPYKIPISKWATTLLRASLFHVVHLLKGIPDLPTKSKWPIGPNWSWWSMGYNEEDALKDSRNDVDILVDVDASQADDQLVMKMCSALKEMHTEPGRIIDFVLRTIAFRLQTEVQTRPLPLMLDLSQLSVQTCTILMDTVADVLAREVSKFPDSDPIKWNRVARDCLFLLSARLPCLLSDRAMRVVSLCFTGSRYSRLEGTFGLIFGDVPLRDLRLEDQRKRRLLCLHLLTRLRNTLLHLNAWELHCTIFVMAKKACCTCDGCMTFTDVMEEHGSVMSSVLGPYMCDVLTGYMLHQVKDNREWNEWHRDILLSIFSQRGFPRRQPWNGTLEDLVRYLVTKPTYATYFYRFLFHRTEYNEGATKIFRDALTSSNDLEQALTNLHIVFTRYIDEMMKRPELLDDEFDLKLLYFIYDQMSPMGSVVITHKRSVVEEVYLPLWQKTWKTMHRAMCHVSLSTATEWQTRWAHKCLEKIDELDGLWLQQSQPQADAGKKFDEWIEAFNPASSFFDDEIIQDLMKFLPSPERAEYRRVRRIYRKLELEEEQARRTVEEGVDDSCADDDGADAAVADEVEYTSAPLDSADVMLDVPHGHVGNIDVCPADDRLVMKMCNVLKSMSTDPDLTIDFVLKIIAFQLHTELKRPLPHILDFSQLPARTCILLMNTVADIFTREMKMLPETEPIKWTGLIRDCLSLLVSRLPCPLPAKAKATISPCLLMYGSRAGIKLMFTSAQPEEQQDLCVHLQHWLRHTFSDLDARTFLDTIYRMTRETCCTCNYCYTMDCLVECHADTISSVLKQHTCHVLAGYLLHQAQIDAQFNIHHCRILSILLSQRKAGAEDVPWHGALKELMPHLLTGPKFAPYCYPILFRWDMYLDSAAPIFSDAFIASTKKQQMLVNMYNTFSTYFVPEDLRDERYFLNLLRYVDGQMAPMMHVAKNEHRAVVEALYLPVWQLIWKTMHNAMGELDRPCRTKELTELARVCLGKIDDLDELWLPTNERQTDRNEGFDNWVKVFDPAKSFFDDDLIEDLMRFLAQTERAEYQRARRVYRKRELALLQAEEERIGEIADVDPDGESGATDDEANAVAADDANSEYTDRPSDVASLSASLDTVDDTPATTPMFTPATEAIPGIPDPGQLRIQTYRQ